MERRYTRFEDVLADPAVDFVHINTPLTEHGTMTIAALKADKHVLCTVPMSISLEECRQIVELVHETGLKYMMAETVLYAREFLYARELYEKGELGKIQFVQGSHHQDMDGWPDGWPGLPPMYYATHCISPCLAIVGGEAEYVSCFGSGRIQDGLIAHYGSPFAVETANITLRASDVCARVYRALFDVARQYRESFDVFGTKKSIEWPLVEGEGLVLHTAKETAGADNRACLCTGLRTPPPRAHSTLHDQNVPGSTGISASGGGQRSRPRRYTFPSGHRSLIS